MNMFSGLVALSFVFFFVSTANALQCAQGVSEVHAEKESNDEVSEIHTKNESNEIKNAECTSLTHVCHRIKYSISERRKIGMHDFFSCKHNLYCCKEPAERLTKHQLDLRRQIKMYILWVCLIKPL